ncbi:hypothetical protein, partial [Acidovorax soli]|uniref:hypothetical protein n=1 Tax=Acidovorax soli TaxID=592050 RepID=UPI0032B1040D
KLSVFLAECWRHTKNHHHSAKNPLEYRVEVESFRENTREEGDRFHLKVALCFCANMPRGWRNW